MEQRRTYEPGVRTARRERGERERESFLRLLAGNAQDVLYRYRVRPDPGFEYVSPSCTRITGYTPEEHYADPGLPMRLVHPDDRPLLDAMYAAGTPDDAVLLRWVRRDGTVVWTEQRTVAVRDEDGHIVAVEGIARDVSERHHAEERLEAMREELQRLALLRDRERIARELHDGVIQALFGVGMVLQVAESQDADDRLIRARVSDAMRAIDRIIIDVRSYVYRLRPSLLQRASLLDALQRLVADVESRCGVIGVVECDDEATDLLHPVAPEVVQMVRGALGNVAGHARALTCRVSLHREGEVVRIAVEDDGRGFDPAQVAPGQGLDNLGDRARELDGWLLVHSSAGAGTTVEMLLPVATLRSRAAQAAQAAPAAPVTEASAAPV